MEEEPYRGKDGGADDDERKVVVRDVLAEDAGGSPETRRAWPEQLLRAPDGVGRILYEQHEPERGDELEQLRRLVDAPENENLEDAAEDGDCDGREQHAEPEPWNRAADARHQRIGDIGPDHVERAVGEIHDPRHAKDDGKPRGDQEQGRRIGEARQELREVEAHCSIRLRATPSVPRYSFGLSFAASSSEGRNLLPSA